MCSYAAYLATEQNSERRHEFFDGVIVAMAGGSYEHIAIAAQDARCVKIYRHTERGAWSSSSLRIGDAERPVVVHGPP
jgi:hypothetical protein